MASTRIRVPLREDWAQSLLGDLHNHLRDLRTQLAARVQEAQEILTNHSLVPMVARAALQESRKRGVPSVIVTPDGIVYLEVIYGAATTPLGSLKKLREKAVALGIDPLTCGRSRKQLQHSIDARKEAMDKQEDSKPPVKKMFKTAPALTQPVIVNPDSLPFGRPGLAEDILDGLVDPQSTPPVAVVVPPPVIVPAPGTGRRNLKVLAKQSQEIDIEAILTPIPDPLPESDSSSGSA